MRRDVGFVVIAASLLAGCSSRPREFRPTLAAAPADQAKYDVDYEQCRTLVASGQRSNFGARVASGGVGAAAGVGVAAATMGGTYGTMGAAAAAASAAVVMMPVVGIAAAWGMAKRSKLRKEREIKSATALCLAEQGHQVAGWERTKRKVSAAPAE